MKRNFTGHFSTSSGYAAGTCSSELGPLLAGLVPGKAPSQIATPLGMISVDRIWEGTSEIQRVIIANQIKKRGLETYTGWID